MDILATIYWGPLNGIAVDPVWSTVASAFIYYVTPLVTSLIGNL